MNPFDWIRKNVIDPAGNDISHIASGLGQDASNAVHSIFGSTGNGNQPTPHNFNTNLPQTSQPTNNFANNGTALAVKPLVNTPQLQLAPKPNNNSNGNLPVVAPQQPELNPVNFNQSNAQKPVAQIKINPVKVAGANTSINPPKPSNEGMALPAMPYYSPGANISSFRPPLQVIPKQSANQPHTGAIPIDNGGGNPVSNFLGMAGSSLEHAGAGLAKSVGQIASIPYNAFKTIPDSLTGNKVALNNANIATNRDINTAKSFVQFIPRAAVQVRNSIAEGLGGNGGKQQLSNFIPQKGWEQTILGNQPIQSLQGQFRAEQKTSGTEKAAIDTTLSGLTDALAIKGGVDTLLKSPNRAIAIAGKTNDIVRGNLDQPTQNLVNNTATHNLITRASQGDIPKPEEIQSALTEGTKPVGAGTRIAHPSLMANVGDHFVPTETTPIPTAEEQSLYDSAPNAPARDYEAEGAAQQALQNNEGLDGAVKAYQTVHPGKMTDDALFQIKSMARESGTNITTHTENPEEGLHNLPNAKDGQYDRAKTNRNIVNAAIDGAHKLAKSAIKKLSENDRANLVHYTEGTKDINESENPDAVQNAVQATRRLTDTVNAVDHASGSGTPHVPNYFPNVVDRGSMSEAQALQVAQDVEESYNPADWGRMTDAQRNAAIEQALSGKEDVPPLDAVNYGGYRNLRREYTSRAEGESKGIKYAYDDPLDALNSYVRGAKYKIGNQAFMKAAKEADVTNGLTGKSQDVRIGNSAGDTFALSEKGAKALKNYNLNHGKSAVLKVSKKMQAAQMIGSVPHAVIVPPRVLLPTVRLAVENAIRGEHYTGDSAQLDEDLARIGSPTHSKENNAGVDFATKGKSIAKTLNPLTAAKRLVYDHLLPALHRTLGKQAITYIQSKGWSLDSPEALSLGKQINNVMGYAERGNNFFEDNLYAPALIKSTAKMFAGAPLKGHIIDRYGVLSHELTGQAVGFLSKSISNQMAQNYNNANPNSKTKEYVDHNDFWSTVWQSASSPGVNTPYENAHGEQTRLTIPGNYETDPTKILTTTTRKPNGQLGVTWNDPKTDVSNAARVATSFLGPLASGVENAFSNTAYNGTQIRTPSAPLPTQIAQQAIHTAAGVLPIGTQGVVDAYVKSKLPANLQNSIATPSASSPTGVKIGAGILGLNPTVNTTTGQGPSIQAYYKNLTTMMNSVAGSKTDTAALNQFMARDKNAQGQNVANSPAESLANYMTLYAHPGAMAAYSKFQRQNNPNPDPLWTANPALQKQALDYLSQNVTNSQRSAMLELNPQLQALIKTRSAYFADPKNFAGMTPDAPNPQAVTYPTFTGVQANQYNYYQNNKANWTTQQKAVFLQNNPLASAAIGQISNYYNQEAVAQGGLKTNDYISLNPAQNDWYNQYLKQGSSASKKQFAAQNPAMYNTINTIMSLNTLNSLSQSLGVSQYQGTSVNQNALKDLYNSAYNVGKNATTGQYAYNGLDQNGNQESMGALLANPMNAGISTGLPAGFKTMTQQASASRKPRKPISMTPKQAKPRSSNPQYYKRMNLHKVKIEHPQKITLSHERGYKTKVLKATKVLK